MVDDELLVKRNAETATAFQLVERRMPASSISVVNGKTNQWKFRRTHSLELKSFVGQTVTADANN